MNCDKAPLAASINSNKVPWSTFRKSASHELMSSVRFSLLSSSSTGIGSSLWKVAHCSTFRKIAEFTFGSGTGSSSPSSMPKSSSIVLMVPEHFAICTSVSKISPSDDCSLMMGIVGLANIVLRSSETRRILTRLIEFLRPLLSAGPPREARSSSSMHRSESESERRVGPSYG
uniref:Uncharacterized protein n=1 Tax=Anopheles culicifacies TaxID=139723 RepID=A0A182MRY7_9DIPT